MSYDILTIPAILIIAYILTYLSYQRSYISRNFHNKLWNLILLISFIFTAGLGTVQAGIVDFGMNFSMIATLNYWHIEFGIIFFVLIFIHLSTNWNSLKKLIKGSQ
jgi:hypothetical protein